MFGMHLEIMEHFGAK